MLYEWDERKNLENQRKHEGISFELAALVFEDEDRLIGLDRVDKNGEQRWHAIGAVSIEGIPSLFCSLFMHTGRIAMVKKSSASSRRAGVRSMKSEDIVNRKWTEREREIVRKAATAQVAGDDSGIVFSDIPRLTQSQLSHLVRVRRVKRKVAVSVRLDPEVLDWLRSKGDGHLTRINDILANLMDAERRASAAS